MSDWANPVVIELAVLLVNRQGNSLFVAVNPK